MDILKLKKGYPRLKFEVKKVRINKGNIIENLRIIIENDDLNTITQSINLIIRLSADDLNYDLFTSIIKMVHELRPQLFHNTIFVKIILKAILCNYFSKEKCYIIFEDIVKNYADERAIKIILLTLNGNPRGRILTSYILRSKIMVPYLIIMSKYYPELVPNHMIMDTEVYNENNNIYEDLINKSIILFKNIKNDDYSEYLLANTICNLENHRKFNNRLIKELIEYNNRIKNTGNWVDFFEVLEYCKEKEYISDKTYNKWKIANVDIIL